MKERDIFAVFVQIIFRIFDFYRMIQGHYLAQNPSYLLLIDRLIYEQYNNLIPSLSINKKYLTYNKMSVILSASTPRQIIEAYNYFDETYQGYRFDDFHPRPLLHQVKYDPSYQWDNASFWFQLIKYMEAWQTDSIDCFFNNKIKFKLSFDNIAHIHFNKLQIISLQHNSINSIQSIAWLDSPTLKTIKLKYNLITSLKPVSKLNISKLQYLDLSENPLRHSELQHLTRLKFAWHLIMFNFGTGYRYTKIVVIVSILKCEFKWVMRQMNEVQPMTSTKLMIQFNQRFKQTQSLRAPHNPYHPLKRK